MSPTHPPYIPEETNRIEQRKKHSQTKSLDFLVICLSHGKREQWNGYNAQPSQSFIYHMERENNRTATMCSHPSHSFITWKERTIEWLQCAVILLSHGKGEQWNSPNPQHMQ